MIFVVQIIETQVIIEICHQSQGVLTPDNTRHNSFHSLPPLTAATKFDYALVSILF